MIVFGIILVYLVFMHIICYARSGKSLFYVASNFFRKLEAAQRTFIACVPIWWQDYKKEYQKKFKKVAQELVIE